MFGRFRTFRAGKRVADEVAEAAKAERTVVAVVLPVTAINGGVDWEIANCVTDCEQRGYVLESMSGVPGATPDSPPAVVMIFRRFVPEEE